MYVNVTGTGGNITYSGPTQWVSYCRIGVVFGA